MEKSVTKTFITSVFRSFTLLDSDRPEFNKLYTQCCRLGYWILQEFGPLAISALTSLLMAIVSPPVQVDTANSNSNLTHVQHQLNDLSQQQSSSREVIRIGHIHLVNIVNSIIEDVERRNSGNNGAHDTENLKLLRQLAGKLFFKALESFRDFTLEGVSGHTSPNITPHDHSILFLTLLTDAARHYIKDDNTALSIRAELKEHQLHQKTIELLESALSANSLGSRHTQLLLRLISACASAMGEEYCNAGLHSKLLDHIVDHIEDGEIFAARDRASTEGLAAMMTCFAHLCVHPKAHQEAQREGLLEVCIKTCKNVTADIVEQCRRSARAKIAPEDIIRLCGSYETISILLNKSFDGSEQQSASMAKLCLDVFTQFDHGKVLLELFGRTSFGSVVTNETKYGPTALYYSLKVIEFMMRLAKDHDDGQEQLHLFTSLSEISNDLQKLLLNIVKSSSSEDNRGSLEDTNYADMLRHEALMVFTLLPIDSIQQPIINELCRVVIEADTSVIIHSTSTHVDLAIQLLTVIVERTPQKNKAIESNAADFIDRLLQLLNAITSTANNLKHNRLLADKTVALLTQLHKRYNITVHDGFKQYQQLIETYTSIARQEEAIELSMDRQYKHLPLERTGIVNDVHLLMEALKRLTLGTNVFLRNMSLLADLLDCDNETERNENHLQFIAHDGLGLLDSLVELINNRQVQLPETQQKKQQKDDGSDTKNKSRKGSSFGKEVPVNFVHHPASYSLKSTSPSAMIRPFGSRMLSDVDEGLEILLKKEVKKQFGETGSSTSNDDPNLAALKRLTASLSDYSSGYWSQRRNNALKLTSPYTAIRKLVTQELVDTRSKLHTTVFLEEPRSKYTLVLEEKQRGKRHKSSAHVGTPQASSSSSSVTAPVTMMNEGLNAAANAVDEEDTWSDISELSVDIVDKEDEEGEDTDVREQDEKQHEKVVKRVHRKSIFLESREPWPLDQEETESAAMKNEEDELPSSMWSHYDMEKCFSSRDFFKVVFDDELEAGDVYRDMIASSTDKLDQDCDKSAYGTYDMWHNSRSKLFLLCGVAAMRILLSLLKRSSHEVAKQMLDKHISPLAILSMVQHICERTRYSSFRINLLTLLVIQQILVTYVGKGRIAEHAASRMKMSRSELQILTVYSACLSLQRINQVIRRKAPLYRSKLRDGSAPSLGQLDLILALHLSRSWHLTVSRFRLLEFFSETAELRQFRSTAASGNMSLSIATDQLFRLNQYCLSVFIGLVLPLPDLAILMRLLFVHAPTQTHNIRMFSIRNLISEWNVMGSVERAFEDVLSDRALLKYAVYYTSPIDNYSLNKLDNDFYTYWTPSNELLHNIAEVIGEYMNMDSAKTHHIIDFIVRMESVTGHPLRPSLFQSILNSVNVMRMRTDLDRFITVVLNGNDATAISSSNIRSMSAKSSGRSMRSLSIGGREHVIAHGFGFHKFEDGQSNGRLLVAGSKHIYLFSEHNNALKLLVCYGYSELTFVHIGLGGKRIAIGFQSASSRDSSAGVVSPIVFEFTEDAVAERIANVIINHCNFTTATVNHDMIDPVFHCMYQSIRSTLDNVNSDDVSSEKICFYSRCTVVKRTSKGKGTSAGVSAAAPATGTDDKFLCVTSKSLAIMEENAIRVFMAAREQNQDERDVNGLLTSSQVRGLKDLTLVEVDQADPLSLLLTFHENKDQQTQTTETLAIRLPSDASVQFCRVLLQSTLTH